jgi:putative transposase
MKVFVPVGCKDDKILSMYALGMTTRQIQDHLKDIYAVDVSPELI